MMLLNRRLVSSPMRPPYPLPLRHFAHSSLRSNLIYKNNQTSPLVKSGDSTPPTHNTATVKEAPKETTKMEKRYEKLVNSKTYQKIPNFLKSYIRLIYIKPLNFTLAFTILHELTAIIPFLGFWLLFIKFDWMPLEFDLPLESLEKGFKVISENIANVDRFTPEEKSKIISSGANSYALTKLLIPIRIPLSVVLSPWFDRWIISPIGSGFRLLKALIVKPASNPEPTSDQNKVPTSKIKSGLHNSSKK